VRVKTLAEVLVPVNVIFDAALPASSVPLAAIFNNPVDKL
jgi:hypothetical protein